MEQAGQGGAGGVFAVGPPERLADLGVDLGLAQDHRVEAGGDAEQVFRGVVVPVGVEGLRELVDVHAARLGQQALQGQEPGMEARDVAVDLNAVAGRQDHGLVDALEVLEATVRLGEVVVGEREPLKQLDRRATERDPEGEDGHGRPMS